MTAQDDTGPGCHHDRLAHPAQVEAQKRRDTETHQRAARYQAQRIIDAIAAGRILFTNTANGRMIVGPTGRITSGATVTVTKLDGDTVSVRVGTVHGSYEQGGLQYTIAAFNTADDSDPPQTCPAPQAAHPLTYAIAHRAGYLVARYLRHPTSRAPY